MWKCNYARKNSNLFDLSVKGALITKGRSNLLIDLIVMYISCKKHLLRRRSLRLFLAWLGGCWCRGDWGRRGRWYGRLGGRGRRLAVDRLLLRWEKDKLGDWGNCRRGGEELGHVERLELVAGWAAGTSNQRKVQPLDNQAWRRNWAPNTFKIWEKKKEIKLTSKYVKPSL